MRARVSSKRTQVIGVGRDSRAKQETQSNETNAKSQGEKERREQEQDKKEEFAQEVSNGAA